MFTGMTDPTPYISAAFGLSALLIAAYSLWQVRHRRQLRELEKAAAADRSSHH